MKWRKDKDAKLSINCFYKKKWVGYVYLSIFNQWCAVSLITCVASKYFNRRHQAKQWVVVANQHFLLIAAGQNVGSNIKYQNMKWYKYKKGKIFWGTSGKSSDLIGAER